MQQTTNYHLNQWDPVDRILRTNFNSDNSKIDAAIKTVETATAAEAATRAAEVAAVDAKAGTRFLRTIVTTETAKTVNIHLTDLDWGAWSAIHISIDPMTVATSVSFYLSGAAMGFVWGNAPTDVTHENMGHMMLYPLFDAQRPIGGVALCKDIALINAPTRFQAASTLTLVGNGGDAPILPGTVVKIWGVK